MGSALVSVSSAPYSSPDRGHCVVFLGKTLHSYSASLHPSVQTGTGELNAGGEPWDGLASHPGGSRYTPRSFSSNVMGHLACMQTIPYLLLIYFGLENGFIVNMTGVSYAFIDFSKWRKILSFTVIGWRQSTPWRTHSEIRFTPEQFISPPWGMMSTNLSPRLKNNFRQNANGNFQCSMFLRGHYLGGLP